MKKENNFMENQRRIIGAIILQDMKTRYGGGYTGYLIAMAYPLVHLGVIISGYLLVNRIAPIGSDPLVFILTGCLPYILCQYPTRLIAMAATANKPFLNYNIVVFHHIVIARTILEFLNVGIVVLIVILACYVTGNDIYPSEPATAVGAIAASVLFGVSLGVFFATITAILGPLFVLFVSLFGAGLYISSMAYIPDYLIDPKKRAYLEYNPMYVLIHWLRSAYFPSYSLNDNNPVHYIVSLSFVLIFFGLLLERFLRGGVLR